MLAFSGQSLRRLRHNFSELRLSAYAAGSLEPGSAVFVRHRLGPGATIQPSSFVAAAGCNQFHQPAYSESNGLQRPSLVVRSGFGIFYDRFSALPDQSILAGKMGRMALPDHRISGSCHALSSAAFPSQPFERPLQHWQAQRNLPIHTARSPPSA